MLRMFLYKTDVSWINKNYIYLAIFLTLSPNSNIISSVCFLVQGYTTVVDEVVVQRGGDVWPDNGSILVSQLRKKSSKVFDIVVISSTHPPPQVLFTTKSSSGNYFVD